MENEFELNESITGLAIAGETFYLSGGYYTNLAETLYIKSCNKNYQLFTSKKSIIARAKKNKE